MNELRIPNGFLAASLLLLLIRVLSVGSVCAQEAINFTLKDINGTSHRLSDYFGEKTVLINFWATWCQPCVRELLHLQDIQDRLEDDGLLILAVSVDGPGTRSQVAPFIERYDLTFPVLLDTDSKILTIYDPQVILPYSVLIDREGNIEYVHKGYSPGDEAVLEDRIVETLNQEPQSKADGISYQFNDSFVFRNFSDQRYVDDQRNGRSTEVLNQSNLIFTAAEYIVGLRFDSNVDYSPMEDRHVLANRFLEIDRGGTNVRIGDFYHVIGRGVTLSLAKLFEKEGLEHTLDSSIRGTRVTMNRERYSAEFFGGTIGSSDSEESDDLWGGTVGINLGRSIDLQISHLSADIVTGLNTGRDKYSLQTLGLSLPRFSGIARASGEFSLLSKTSSPAGIKSNGYALYLESGLDLGNLSFQVELKDYDHFDFKYSRPPSLESEELEIMATHFNTEVIDMTGVAGRFDYRPGAGSTLVFGKLSFFNDTPDDHPIWGEYRKEISHYLTGFERYFGNSGYVNVLAGYRVKDTSSPLFFFSDSKTFHYQLNGFYTMVPGLSLEADWKSQDHQAENFGYTENRAFLALHWVSRGIVTLFYERSNDPELMLVTDKTEWWAGQIEVKLSSSNSISAMFGSTKGGVKCSGGVCRAFPSFEGFRLEMIFRL